MSSWTAMAILPMAAVLGTYPARGDEAFDQCKAAANADVGACGEAWLAREQGALDAKWLSIIEQTDGGVADSLASEQTAWLAFKDASCGFMRDNAFAPGGDKTTFFACRARIIQARSNTLAAYAAYIDN